MDFSRRLARPFELFVKLANALLLLLDLVVALLEGGVGGFVLLPSLLIPVRNLSRAFPLVDHGVGMGQLALQGGIEGRAPGVDLWIAHQLAERRAFLLRQRLVVRADTGLVLLPAPIEFLDQTLVVAVPLGHFDRIQCLLGNDQQRRTDPAPIFVGLVTFDPAQTVEPVREDELLTLLVSRRGFGWRSVSSLSLGWCRAPPALLTDVLVHALSTLANHFRYSQST